MSNAPTRLHKQTRGLILKAISGIDSTDKGFVEIDKVLAILEANTMVPDMHSTLAGAMPMPARVTGMDLLYECANANELAMLFLVAEDHNYHVFSETVLQAAGLRLANSIRGDEETRAALTARAKRMHVSLQKTNEPGNGKGVIRCKPIRRSGI